MIFAIAIFVAGIVMFVSIILICSNYNTQALTYDRNIVSKINYSNEFSNDLLNIKAATGIHEAKYVSIVQDAAYVGNKAFSPNPINIKVRDTITWTNDDVETHTVTSGLGFNNPDFGKKFDSGIMEYKQTFSHQFGIAGELDYFCQFHPTMVGKVIVN
jgi:plastocyanin